MLLKNQISLQYQLGKPTNMSPMYPDLNAQSSTHCSNSQSSQSHWLSSCPELKSQLLCVNYFLMCLETHNPKLVKGLQRLSNLSCQLSVCKPLPPTYPRYTEFC